MSPANWCPFYIGHNVLNIAPIENEDTQFGIYQLRLGHSECLVKSLNSILLTLIVGIWGYDMFSSLAILNVKLSLINLLGVEKKFFW